MIRTFSLTTTNPHIAALEKLFKESAKPIEWLVISHNDSQMIRSLSSALTDEEAVILEFSQDLWDYDENILSQTIEWAVQLHQIKNLVIVGTSQTGGSESRASYVGKENKEKEEDGFASIWAGVQRFNDRNRYAQLRFVSHIQRISENPVVQSRWSNRELAFYGLFYRAESGAYLSYDLELDTFLPLDLN